MRAGARRTSTIRPRGVGSPCDDEDRPHARYFTVGHLIAEGDPAFTVQPLRDGLRQAIADLAKSPPRVDPVDGLHTVFGQVTSGMDVVGTISHVDTDMQDRPLAEVRIESVAVGG